SGPRMGDSLVWLAAFGALEQPEARGPFLVGVLAVVLADVLDDLVVRHAPVSERHRPRLLEHLRILDRDLVPEDVRPHEPEALRDAHIGRVRHVAEPHVLLDADRIDYERVAAPRADGAAVEPELDIVERQLRLAQIDAANLAVRLLRDVD